MSKTEPPLSVEEVLEMQEGEWINAGLRGVVLFIEKVNMSRAPGYFHKVTLGSETSSAQIPFSLFVAPKFKAKDVIEISGQGNKVKMYNGVPEVGVGRNGEIHVVTSAPVGVRPPPPRTAASDDSRGSPPAQGDTPPAADDTSPHGANPIPGQEVGMALKEALLLVPKAYGGTTPFSLTDLDSPIFWRRVHVAASDILRISTMLRRGSIAPNVVERGKPAEPPAAREEPPKPPAAQREESHTPPARNVTPSGRRAPSPPPPDEDVPF